MEELLGIFCFVISESHLFLVDPKATFDITICEYSFLDQNIIFVVKPVSLTLAIKMFLSIEVSFFIEPIKLTRELNGSVTFNHHGVCVPLSCVDTLI